MASDTEFLYPGESIDSQFFKVVRIARYLREMQINTPEAHIAVVGLLSTRILMFTTVQMERERFVIKDMLWRARMNLLQCQLTDKSIRVYVPYKCVPIERPGQVVLFALNTAPRPAGPYMWDHQPKVQTAVSPEVEASLNMEYDVKAHEEDEKHKEELDSLISCEIEVKIWESKGPYRQIQFLPEAKVTLKVGPTGIEEVGTELTALKIRLKELSKTRIIKDVQISVKGETGIEIKRTYERARLDDLFAKWQAKMKVSFSAELRIPKTSIKLPISITPYLDHEGQPGVELQVTLPLKILE